jgi:integron integrase
MLYNGRSALDRNGYRRRHRGKLLDQLSDALRTRRYSPRTEQAYRSWVQRYVRFHGTRHPADLETDDINQFLTTLAVEQGASASTQAQARAALLFLYRQVLGISLEDVGAGDPIVRGKQPQTLPVVMTRREVGLVLRQLKGEKYLVASLLYGSGLRLGEALALRPKDLDLERRELVVRRGKRARDRVSVVPSSLVPLLQDQLTRRRALHDEDLSRGAGWSVLPDRYAVKSPRAGFQFGWQFLFPSSSIKSDPRTGFSGRYHRHPSSVQRAVKAAARSVGTAKNVKCHTFRHSFATHLLDDGYDIRTIQQLMGHKDVRTTMIYTHVLNRGGLGIRSPLDVVGVESRD